MDSYAVRSADLPLKRLRVAGESGGRAYPPAHQAGGADLYRSPGAPGADAVIPQERVRRRGRRLIDEAANRENIRDLPSILAAGCPSSAAARRLAPGTLRSPR